MKREGVHQGRAVLCSGGEVSDGQRQSFPVEVQKAEGLRVCEHSVGNKKEPWTS